MKKITRNKIFSGAMLALLLTGQAQLGHAEVIVVVHPNNDIELTEKEVQRIFLGKLKAFPGGQSAIPVDLPPGSKERDEFNKSIIKKNAKQVSSYWSRLIFTGKGLPPKQVDAAADAKALVARNPDAIAYIDKSMLDGTVKMVSFK